MKHLKLFEKFKEKDYLKAKKKRDQKGIQKLGDKFIVDIIENGDFEGLDYLLSTGYNIQESVPDLNLFVNAVKSNQPKMIDFLMKSDYAPEYENPINSVLIEDFISNPSNITTEEIEWLKTITKYGYDFGHNNHNQIKSYLTEGSYKKINRKEVYIIVLINGAEPFIDWLLENYPKNYPLCKEFLPNNLKEKYSYLEDSEKYNM